MPTVEELEAEEDRKVEGNLGTLEKRLRAIKDKLKVRQTEELETKGMYQPLREIFKHSLKILCIQILQKP